MSASPNSASPRSIPRGARLIAVGACALAACSATAVAAPVAAVNPALAPVIVTPVLGGAPPMEPVRLRVTLPRGATVALSRPVMPRNGRVALRWNGRRGAGTTGPLAPDGRYLMVLETTSGVPVPAVPAQVRLDTTPPRVGLIAPGVSPSADPRVGVRVRDRSPVRLRMVVRSLMGATLAAGPWTAEARSLPLPERLTRSGRVGAVRVSVQARDAAGNRAESQPVVLALPGPAGPARAITRVRTARPWVALTIDDGYDAAAVSSMVDTATRMRAPLLLCINGSAASGYSPALRTRLRAAAAAGWIQSCNHGFSHRTGSGTSFAAARADLSANVVWDRAVGQSSLPFYRPPYGAIGPGIMAAASDLGYRHVLLWDVDTNDWRHRSTQTTTAHTLANASRGSIVLMHALPSTARALPAIISGLRARGLEPVSMGDLIAAGTPVR